MIHTVHQLFVPTTHIDAEMEQRKIVKPTIQDLRNSKKKEKETWYTREVIIPPSFEQKIPHNILFKTPSDASAFLQDPGRKKERKMIKLLRTPN